METELPRGIRNNNPGNIRRGSPWQGLMPKDWMTPEQRTETQFCVFTEPKWGIRAMARTLLTYQRKHNILTIADAINRWAPPSENATSVYVVMVQARTGIAAKAPLVFDRYWVMGALVTAIIHHENGQQPYARDVIDEGLRLAGIMYRPEDKA